MSCPGLRLVGCVGWLAVTACSLETSGLQSTDQDAASAPADVGVGRDASSTDADFPSDARTDDARVVDVTAPTDTGSPCVPVDEVCDAVDQDCDGTVDEGTCVDCRVDWRSGFVYLFCPHRLPWNEARSYCTDRGYDLVTLENAPLDDWVWSGASTALVEDWWIGLTDSVTEGRYVWVDGSVAWESGAAVGFTHFRDVPPPDNEEQDCIELDGPSAGAWADGTCSQLQPFICEQAAP